MAAQYELLSQLLKSGGRLDMVTWGAGTDTDIIVAGIKALVSAINSK